MSIIQDEMIALLERIANEFISDERGCPYCHATLEYPQPIVQHKDDCPIAQVRKFLELEKHNNATLPTQQ